ncbi:MAG: M90 family metallopeptidase [Burkholderiales bacterium]
MLKRLYQWLRQRMRHWLRPRPIPDALWHATLAAYPFLQNASDLPKLRQLCSRFLAQKEFHGTHGLVVTDEIALAIAAQACLPVLHLGLHWYKDFVGIVVYPGAMLAQREVRDSAGVVHRYREPLAGQAMHQGPVVLNWQDVSQAGASAAQGTNLVIHEFAHKIDLYGAPQDADADGCPPLPGGFGGTPRSALGARNARELWRKTLYAAYEQFANQVQVAQRFGTLVQAPWLDAYGATSPAEFFAVTLEAYFVARPDFALHYPSLLPLYDAFFRRPQAAL